MSKQIMTRRAGVFYFGEVYGTRLSNAKAVKLIKEINPLNKLVTADSAEPRTINEFKLLGLNIIGAKKGADSVDNGIKFLQDLDKIIIDPVRCPNAAREFNDYEIEMDRDGNLRGDFPDRNNHTIDAVRYAMEYEILQKSGLCKGDNYMEFSINGINWTMEYADSDKDF